MMCHPYVFLRITLCLSVFAALLWQVSPLTAQDGAAPADTTLVQPAPAESEGEEPSSPTPAAGSDEGTVEKRNIRLQRVLVPDSHKNQLLEELIRTTGVKYMPMEREKYLALVKKLLRARSRIAPAGARITQASYHATWERDKLTGIAGMQVELNQPGESFAPLAGNRLAIISAAWRSTPPTEAQVAMTPTGDQVLVVPKAGTVDLAWTLKGKRSQQKEYVFDIRLPQAAVTRMTLDLPAGYTPQLSAGVVTEAPSRDKDDDSDPASYAAGEPAEGETRWLLLISPAETVRLTIVPVQTDDARQVVSRSQVQHTITQRGLNYEADIQLDVHGASPAELVMQLSGQLLLTSARCNGVERPFAYQDDGKTVVLDLPVINPGQPCTIQLSGRAPVTTNGRFKLPSASLTGTAWESGVVTLQIAPPLRAASLDLQNSVQSGYAPAEPGVDGAGYEVHRFSNTASNSGITLQLQQQAAGITAQCASSVKIGQLSTSATFVAKLSVQSQAVFATEFTVPREWIVDTASVRPAGVLDDWSITTAGLADQNVKVRLKKPIQPQRSIEVTLKMHRRVRADLLPTPAQLLELADIPAATRISRTTGVYTVAPFRILLSGDGELKRLDRQKLPAEIAGMLNVPDDAVVYQGSSDKARLRLVDEPVQYSAELESTVIVDGKTLEETHTIRCLPSAAGVSSLLVHFAETGKTPLQFSLTTGETGAFKTHQLTEEEQQSANVGSGETYQIDFDRPRTKRFSIAGVRSSKLDDSHQLPLPSLPSAVSQTGLLLIGVRNDEELDVSAGSLRTAPLPVVPPGTATQMRAAYVFDPAQTAVVSLAAAPHTCAAAWAWESYLRSRFGASSVSHRVVYKLQNEGEDSVAVKLPANATQVVIKVNGANVQPVTDSGAHVVTLPSGQLFPLVSIEFVEPVARLGRWTELSPPVISPDFPVMEHRWTVATPPGYKLKQPAASPSNGQPDALTRIFGAFYSSTAADKNGAAGLESILREAWAEEPTDTRRQNILGVLGELWLKEPETNRDEPRNWRALLQRYEEKQNAATDSRLPGLEIDSLSMHRAGITPSTPLPPPPAGRDGALFSELDYREAGAALLKQSALQLTTADAAFVLTSASTDENQKVNLPLIMEVEKWVSAAPFTSSPWVAASAPDSGAWRWNIQSDVTSIEAPGPVMVYQPAFWRAAGWVALFLTAIAAVALLRHRPLWILPVTAVGVLVAITAPDIVAPVTTGICLGCISAALVLAIHSCMEHVRNIQEQKTNATTNDDTPGDAEESQTATASFRAPASIVLIAMTGVFAQLQAEETAPKVVDYKVVFPVDEDEKPTKYIFVPKPVFDRMLSLESESTTTGDPWLISRANYSCQISRKTADGKLDVSACTARFQLNVRRRGASVSLPFSSRQLDLLPGSVLIDGASAEFAWSKDGDALEIETVETGVQELTIEFIPRTTAVAERSSFEINIPPAPIAELRVKTAEDISNLELASTLGPSRIDTTTGDLLTPLGPVKKLQMSWPQQNGGATQEPSAKQLVWLQIQPKSVLCRTATTLSAPAGKAIRTLEFEVDSRLQIAAGRSANISSIMVSPKPSPTGMKRVSLLLDRDYQAEEFSVHVSYLVTGATGTGITRLPRVEVAGCRTLRRWFAVSTGKGLEHSIQGAGQLAPQSASAFKTAWELAGAPVGASDTPDVAYAAMPLKDEYQVLTSPPADPVSATVQELLLAGSDKVHYEASIEIDAGETRNFHHAFAEMDRIRIDEATMLQGGASTPLDFATTGDGVLSVFATRPMTGVYTIRLSGELAGTQKFSRRNIWHTMLQFNNALVDQHYIDLYRYFDAKIKTSRVIKLEPNLEDTSPAPREGARIAGRWKVQASAGGSPALPRMNFEISPNRPRAECRRLVRLERTDGEWRAAMRCLGTVNRDQLDTLRIEFSPQWSAPFECEPKAKITIEPVPGSNLSRMHLEFEKPLSGDFDVRVTGGLNPASGERIAAPQIEPLDMTRVERRLLLPMRAQEQLFNWKTAGLIKDPLPAVFASEMPEGPAAAYRVVGAEPKAEIADVENIRGTPQVWLSDIYLKWSENGRATGVASFDLEPGGLEAFDLRLPPGWKMTSIYVGGAPVLAGKVHENRYRITSALRQLPQRVSVVFDADLRPGDGGWKMESPELVDIPVARQLWTIYGPQDTRQAVSETGKRVDIRQQEIFRHKAICSVVEGAADTLAESNPRDVARWHPAWVSRLMQSRSRFNRLPSIAGDAADPLDVDHRAVGERLERWAGDTSSWEAPRVAGSPVDVFVAEHRGQKPVHLAFRGTATGFTVQENHRANSWTQQLSVGVAMAALLCVLWLLLRIPNVASAAMRGRYAIGVALGVLWWLMMTPAVAGLIFAFVCCFAAVMQRTAKQTRGAGNALSSN